MSNTYFNFKQFSVKQDKCAMKIGTDGVLLGAWTDVGSASTILDIGTGTGLLALMLAQRSPAYIFAIECEYGAIQQAGENFTKSKWKDRLTLFSLSLQEHLLSGKQYDLVVSNPPFFENSLKSPMESRNFARHTVSLTSEDLFKRVITIAS